MPLIANAGASRFSGSPTLLESLARSEMQVDAAIINIFGWGANI